jgi:hypothetical protein
MATHTSKTTTDHDEIRRWAEAREARPARVKGTGRGSDPGMIRLDLPGYSGAESLQPISWEEWFEAFDDNDLAFVYQDTLAGGGQSNFNKLIGRETAEERAHGKSQASRRHGNGSASRSTSGRSSGSRSTSARGAGGKTSSRSRSSASRSGASGSRSASGRSASGRSAGGKRGASGRSSSGRSPSRRSRS